MKGLRLFVATGLFLSLSACAVGPNYTRPSVETPAIYRGAEAPFDGKSLADLQWWDVFRDPTLKALIEEALASNYDTRIAAARVGCPSLETRRHGPFLRVYFPFAGPDSLWSATRRARSSICPT